eukprot:2666050-Rhodomonas_salina.1
MAEVSPHSPCPIAPGSIPPRGYRPKCARDAKSGTHLGYTAQSGTELAMLLHIHYALSGTDAGYATTRPLYNIQ